MKKIINIFALVMTGALIFAQEIELPEVVTEIETENEVAETEALPDFSQVFEQPEGTGDIVPELPEIEIQDSKVAASADTGSSNKIYAEGKLGGGYPSLIYGDFSVYELSAESPFKIAFTHDSAAGYAKHSLNDGFNDSLTSMDLEKGLTAGNFDFTFTGNYTAEKNGLQNLVDNISDLSQNTLDGYADVCWNLPNHLFLSSSFGAGIYNRFADITGDSEEIPAWVKQFTGFSLTPDLKFGFRNKGFDAEIGAQYWFDKEYSVSNRGEFGFDFSWQNDFVKPFASCSIVVGNKLNENPVVVPFAVGINSSIPVKFATNRLCINAQGGIESDRKSIADYEKFYKFTGFSDTVSEVSEWYGNLEFVVPVKSVFTSSFKTEYRHTAFNNGRYVPVYGTEEAPAYGIYGYECKNIQMLTTDLNFMVNYKLFSMTALWHSNWLDVPALESQNMLNLTFSLQDKKSVWNVNLISEFYIEDAFDIPLLSLTGSYKINDGVQLMASVEDIIKLVGGGSRIYGGQYISRSGTASVLVKFFF